MNPFSGTSMQVSNIDGSTKEVKRALRKKASRFILQGILHPNLELFCIHAHLMQHDVVVVRHNCSCISLFRSLNKLGVVKKYNT